LKHLAVQPADAWHSFITWSAGIDSWSQQSCADATTTSEAIGSSLGMPDRLLALADEVIE